MTRLLEVIETTRLIYPDSSDIPVHQHNQHVTTDGTLIVEWCELDADCDHVKRPYAPDGDADE